MKKIDISGYLAPTNREIAVAVNSIIDHLDSNQQLEMCTNCKTPVKHHQIRINSNGEKRIVCYGNPELNWITEDCPVQYSDPNHSNKKLSFISAQYLRAYVDCQNFSLYRVPNGEACDFTDLKSVLQEILQLLSDNDLLPKE